ncbi:fungal specific transcription factor domain-containing protein [Aspergillus udagawae]|uniref:Xylanolytic transcriptional activator regulatory domain-containing protein n=1 Tax=Aspergillus udagawae TaxID=91492 RepID=A0A8E0QJ70_9EURO|nr:uncharacterized protein Aud_002635 [Aspergillus udagawae]GIC86267.1 hypothetical protein Aud_002635 [Aspergillus udagawae]
MPIQSFTQLPDVRIVKSCVAVYYGSSVHSILPVIDRDLFKNTLNLAYSTLLSDHLGSSCAKACVWAFLCLSSIWDPAVAYRLQTNVAAIALEVERYIPRILQEDTIDGLQALLMLMLFHCFSGNFQTALYLDSLIGRLIYKFGANFESPRGSASVLFPETNNLPRMDRHLRRLFWAAYIIDKELSIRMDQPAAITDEACDLTIPPGYGDLLCDIQLLKESSHRELRECLYLTDLRLIKIKSRIYKAIYSRQAMQLPDAGLIKTVRDLDEELEEWRLSIPPQYRPSLSTVAQQVTNIDLPFRIHAINMQMDYYHCLTMIHRACGRCTVWNRGSTTVCNGIATSLKLAAESSRASLTFLQNVLPKLPSGIFWCLVFYPLSACLTIFGNILLFPFEPGITRDFAILESAASLVRALPMNSKRAHKDRLVELVRKLNERAKLLTADMRENPGH